MADPIAERMGLGARAMSREIGETANERSLSQLAVGGCSCDTPKHSKGGLERCLPFAATIYRGSTSARKHASLSFWPQSAHNRDNTSLTELFVI